MFDKCKQKIRLRKGFIKIYAAVETRTKKIISMNVTKEDVHDGKILKELVNDVSKKHYIKKVLADGGYDSKTTSGIDELKMMLVVK